MKKEKKTLVFSLFVEDDFEENIANKIHFCCLNKYINIFDEVRFTISLNDISNNELKLKAINWIMKLNTDKVSNIAISENTNLMECQTFKNEILDKINLLDGAVFFAHNKGVTNFKKDYFNKESIFRWICGMYFYNFNFMDSLEMCFEGLGSPTECFYGTFLTKFDNEYAKSETRLLNVNKIAYIGTFYWMNINRIANAMKLGVVPDLKVDTRFFAEDFPGMFCNHNHFGGGISSFNDFSMNDGDYNLYTMGDTEWNDLISKMGNSQDFVNFCYTINEEIGKENL